MNCLKKGFPFLGDVMEKMGLRFLRGGGGKGGRKEKKFKKTH